MFKKETSFKISVLTLGIISGIDILRGIMHTFFIMFASENIAYMSQTPDTLFLMNAFGISNLLTGCIYLLIIKKAKHLSPYILILMPLVYGIGLFSAHITGISKIQESSWNGQYMMYAYLIISALVGISYFISKKSVEAKD